ncbi:MAG: DUF2029 domain-containing protein [Anaerolineae bacterium]|nr:DUF2029 domain-containing protein [Anaerolineae bacterium]
MSGMNEFGDQLAQTWRQTRLFRIVLVVSAIYALLRLAIHGAYLVVVAVPDRIPGMDMPGWAESQSPPVPVDLQVYLDAGMHFRQRQDLYLQDALTSIEYHFPYPPFYAMLFVPFTWLPPLATSTIHTVLHIAAYALLCVRWGRIFRRLGLDDAARWVVWLLPVWFVFSEFWSDLSYLNIYITMALLSTLLIEALLYERLAWSVLWLALILQTKPMWAFAVAVPLLLGRYRFLARLLAWTVVVYIVIAGTTILIAGPAYGWQQYGDYLGILSRLGRDFPWRGPDAPFLGYNHSIKQIFAYLWGASPQTLNLAVLVKILLLIPLAVVGIRQLLRPAARAGYDVPRLGLDLAFAFYAGAFIWLDIVWEAALGMAVFAYLLATIKRRAVKIWLWIVFMVYVVADLGRIVGLAILGSEVILPGPYVLSDPLIYLPQVMMVLLTFYALLIGRLWRQPAPRAGAGG